MVQRKIISKISFSFFMYIVFVIVIQSIIQFVLPIAFPQLNENDVLYEYVSMLQMYLVAAPLCLIFLKKIPKQNIYKNKVHPGKVVVMLCVCVAAMMIGSWIGMGFTTLMDGITGVDLSFSIEDQLSGGLLSTFFLTVILAPIAEELIFRKLIIDRCIVLGDKTAMLISALLFGLMHGNFSQFFYAAFLGVILSYAYIRTGDIKISILGHMFVNFLCGFIGIALTRDIDLTQFTDGFSINMSGKELLSLAGLGLVGIVEFFMLVVGIVFLIMERKKRIFYKGEFSLPAKEMFFEFVKAPGFWMYIAISAYLFVSMVINNLIA